MLEMESGGAVKEVPLVRVEPPGPKALQVLEEDREFLMQSFVRWYPLVVEKAKGSLVWDVDGNVYIDLNSALAVANVGHTHPRVVDAIKKQAEKFLHFSLTDFYYKEAVDAARDLVGISPFDSAKVFFANSGAESIEGSLKVARGFFQGKRTYIIGFLGAFHGRTMGALSITSSKPVQRRWFSPLVPNIIHVPYPYPYRCPFKSETPEECGEAVLGYIEEWILGKIVDPSEVAAFIFEPIQGEGGYIVPPDNFFRGLRKLADKHGILLIDDEVQAGMGRTGRWFAIEHWGITPDIIAVAKGIAGGLPLGAIIGSSDVMTLPGGSHASTFGGNPVSLAAMREVINIIKEERLLERASRLGEEVIKFFNDMYEETEIIGDVRGKGFMIGVELVKDRKTKEPAKKELATLINRCFKRGVLVIGAGLSVLRIAPPLSIPEEHLWRALEIVGDEIRRLDKEVRA